MRNPYVYVAVVLALIGFLTFIANDEGRLPELTREQKSEVIRNLNTPFDAEHHLGIVSDIMESRVERDWIRRKK